MDSGSSRVALTNTKFISKPFEKRTISVEINKFLEQLTEDFGRVCICGGFPTFLLNKTLNYGDVDIYVNRAFLDETAIAKFGVYRVYSNYYHLIGPLTLYRKCTANVNFEIICMPFLNTLSTEMYALRVLNSFDLEICKNALYMDYSSSNNYFAIETPLSKHIGSNSATETRTLKYTTRINKEYCTTYQPYSLKLAAYIAVVKFS